MERSRELIEAARRISRADQMVLCCHVGPDGDALGSMLGLAWAARRRGIEVLPSFGEPYVLPEMYRFLPIDLLVPPASIPAEPRLMISFDAGSIDRLGSLAEAASMAETLIVVDHHASNTGFGHINVIEPEVSSTAELVSELLDEMSWDLDEMTATCLHTGIVTDTGRFQYSNTSAATLAVASRLVAAGARPERVGRHVYEELPFGYLRVASAVLGRASLEIDRRLVWSTLHASDLEEAGIGMDETDGLIDDLRVARESDVALLLKEVGDGQVKGSLRSRGRIDVGTIAAELGGGGHHNAAGFTFRGTAAAAVDEVRSRLAPLDG